MTFDDLTVRTYNTRLIGVVPPNTLEETSRRSHLLQPLQASSKIFQELIHRNRNLLSIILWNTGVLRAFPSLFPCPLFCPLQTMFENFGSQNFGFGNQFGRWNRLGKGWRNPLLFTDLKFKILHIFVTGSKTLSKSNLSRFCVIARQPLFGFPSIGMRKSSNRPMLQSPTVACLQSP